MEQNESAHRVFNSRMSLVSIDSFIPVLPFNPSLLDVGEDICTVCFETYPPFSLLPGCLVRKLTCKHVFHDTCLSDWMRIREEPRCPNCKFNPFPDIQEAQGRSSGSGQEGEGH